MSGKFVTNQGSERIENDLYSVHTFPFRSLQTVICLQIMTVTLLNPAVHHFHLKLPTNGPRTGRDTLLAFDTGFRHKRASHESWRSKEIARRSRPDPTRHFEFLQLDKDYFEPRRAEAVQHTDR